MFLGFLEALLLGLTGLLLARGLEVVGDGLLGAAGAEETK